MEMCCRENILKIEAGSPKLKKNIAIIYPLNSYFKSFTLKLSYHCS